MCESFEMYWLVNFLIDTTLIAVIARVNGCVNIKRILAVGACCACYALLAICTTDRILHPAVQCILVFLASMCISGRTDLRLWILVAFELFCAAVFVCGLWKILPSSGLRTLFSVLFISAILLWLLLSVRKQQIHSWEVTVCLRLHGRMTSFRALIDTGNRLREPISGLPVLIVEAAMLQKLFPPTAKDCINFRNVSYNVLGSGGNIRCFHPDSILIRQEGRLISAPDAWVAIYPGRIPGISHALAPSSFAVIHGRYEA